MNLTKVDKPIGDFIIKNGVGIQTMDGKYYHYSEVCKLLKLQRNTLKNIPSSSVIIESPQHLNDKMKKLMDAIKEHVPRIPTDSPKHMRLYTAMHELKTELDSL